MTYILAHKQDNVAHWLRACLINSGLIHTKILFAEDLMQIKSMNTSIDADGSVSGNIVFSNDEKLDVNHSVIINRLRYLPHQTNRYADSEKEYAGSELNAILVFFLNAAKKVMFNQIDCNGFNGVNYSVEEWDVLLRKAGFESQMARPNEIHTYKFPTEEILIYEGSLLGKSNTSPILKQNIEEFIKLTGLENFSLTLSKYNEAFIVTQIKTLPDLRVGGQFLIHKIKRKIIQWYL